MKSDYTEYNFKRGIERINQIIDTPDAKYEELEKLPTRDSLTYTNGFHVKCAALFVVIRDPAELTDLHRNNRLAKLYRIYLSEVTAVMNGNSKCAEINIAGTCISGFFDAPWQDDLNEVFSTVGKISSIVRIINQRFSDCPIKIGIGLSYGKALLVKVGYKGTKLGEVIWVGDVVSEASRLASYANKEPADRETMVSEIVYHNLDDENKKLLAFNSARDCYHGSVVNKHMNNLYKQNYP
ncbi:MAG: adenylate/guanylate cyclase domain-containing protein [Candidatus Bathyarchaeia archaeon]|jgi:class 3 adenylate cyclase